MSTRAIALAFSLQRQTIQGRAMSTAQTKAVNPHRIKARQILARYGIEVPEGQKIAQHGPAMDYLEKLCIVGGVAPACCDEGCEVEPDGRCEHDCPSVLLSLGLM